MRRILLILIIISAIFLISCGKNGKKDNNSTNPSKADSSEESRLRSGDEDFSEKFRHTVELGLYNKEINDEMRSSLTATNSLEDVIIVSNDGIKYLKNLPLLKEYLDNEFGDVILDGNIYKSQKYKDCQLIISISISDNTLESPNVSDRYISLPIEPTPILSESDLRNRDVNFAERLRHSIEVGLYNKEIFDEINVFLDGNREAVDMVFISNDGVEYLTDLPLLKEYLIKELGDTLSKGDIFQSEYYKNITYIVSIKLSKNHQTSSTVNGRFK